MKLTLSAFKKASKRYAGVTGKPLAAAQEEFASFFGFANFHAAYAALTSNLAPQSGASHAQPAIAWAGFDAATFLRIVDELKRPIHGEHASWQRKGYELLDGLLLSLLADADGPLTAEQLHEAIELGAIEYRYTKLYQRFKGTSKSWPLAHRPIGRYLEVGLSAYNIAKLLTQRGLHHHQGWPGRFGIRGDEQDPVAIERHSYLCTIIAPILDQLEAIEDAGGAALFVGPAAAVNQAASKAAELMSVDKLIQDSRLTPHAPLIRETSMAA